MTIQRTLVLVLAVAGCVDHTTATPLPGIALDGTGVHMAAPGRGGARECGHDYYYDAGPSTSPDDRHAVTTFVYDAAGRVTQDYDVNGGGRRVYTEMFDYNAMGQPAHQVVTGDYGMFQISLTYDSFGRLVRRSQDTNGDGVEDGFTAYAYGADDRRISWHLENPVQTTDTTYRYDDQGRVIYLDSVSTMPSFTRTLVCNYDDAAHVMHETGTTPATDTGVTTPYLYFTDDITFDGDNLAVLDMARQMNPSGTVVWTDTTTNTYDAGNLTTAVSLTHAIAADGSSLDDVHERYEYHYGDCR